MNWVYNIFLHLLLVGAMLGFLATLLFVAFRTGDSMEKVRRFLALFAGAMVVVGAQASGVSFAAFTTKSLASARAASVGAHLVAAIIPALAGAGLGFYLVRLYRRNDVFGMRVLCFVGMLAIAAFAETYAQTTHTKGVFIDSAAVPNLSFAVAVLLVCTFWDGDRQHRNGLLRAASNHPAAARWRKSLGLVDPAHPGHTVGEGATAYNPASSFGPTTNAEAAANMPPSGLRHDPFRL